MSLDIALEHMYTLKHLPNVTFPAHQYTGPDQLVNDNPFYEFLVGWVSSNDLLVMEGDDRLVFMEEIGMLKTNYVIHPSEWLLNENGRHQIVTDEYFRENYKPLIQRMVVPSALSRHAVVGNTVPLNGEVALGCDAVLTLIDQLTSADRLTTVDQRRLADIPHYDEDDVKAVIKDNFLTISTDNGAYCDVVVAVSNQAVEAKDPSSIEAMVERFSALMIAKFNEMGPIAMNHASLLTELANTLTDETDEDQFIKIGLYAMGLQEVGGFTAGQLLNAENLDEGETDSNHVNNIVDLGDDYMVHDLPARGK